MGEVSKNEWKAENSDQLKQEYFIYQNNDKECVQKLAQSNLRRIDRVRRYDP